MSCIQTCMEPGSIAVGGGGGGGGGGGSNLMSQ